MPTTKPAALDLDSFAGFTPGPWQFHLGRGANPRLHIQTSAGYQVASTPEVNKYETRESDARLIAAAPALLAECKRLRAENQRMREALQGALDCEQSHGQDWQPWAQAARAALEPQS